MEVKPGYKQTEVGVIPEDWESCRLADFLDKGRHIRYGIVQPGKFDPAGCFMLRSQDYSKGWAGPDNMHKVNRALENQYKNARIYCGDLVITVVGAGIGQVVTVPAWLDGAILSRSTARIAIDQNKAARAFVSALLESPLGKRQILDCQKEGAQPVVSCVDLAKFCLPVPPLPEQRAIAEALSDVDGLLGGLDRLIAKKRDLKQAAMQQLLTGQTRLPGFHGEWEVNTVAELEKQKLVKLSRGQVISKKDIDNTPGDFPIYSSSIHNDGLFGRYGDFMFDEELITWSVDGGGNFFHRRKHKFSVTNVCGFMRVDTSRIDYRFFAAELQLLHSRKSFDYQSKAHPSVVRKEYEVQLPPLPEQTAIASVLSEMDGELAVLKQRREKTRALKQAMMQELLTGRTRLV